MCAGQGKRGSGFGSFGEGSLLDESGRELVAAVPGGPAFPEKKAPRVVPVHPVDKNARERRRRVGENAPESQSPVENFGLNDEKFLSLTR